MRLTLRAVPFLLLLLSLSALFLRPKAADTLPLYAARTGLLCQSCHFDPNGGGPRNEFGFAFARNRHALEADPDTTNEWNQLDLTNRIGDRMPLYVSVNQRFMLLDNSTVKSDSLDRFGFFNMENAIYLAFQPHRRLTLVYSRDGFNESASTQDAFGVISGFPWNGYFKAGRFRTPFGVRMDDHTVATRNSFLDFQTGERFLPYDPRQPDMGYEIGGDNGGFFGRLAYTNGGTTPFSVGNTNAQALTAKLGYNRPAFQVGASVYDDFHKLFAFDPIGGVFYSDRERFRRWGLYGLTHVGKVAVLGEIAAGTDQRNVRDAGTGALLGTRTNLLAGFVEGDWAPIRSLNFRLRYDRLETNRSSDDAIRELSSWNRYAVEGEWLMVPFAELRWTLRMIDPVSDAGPLGDDMERQGYLQFHFSY